jgi:hypothetical protein
MVTFVLVLRSTLCPGLNDLIEDTKDILRVVVRWHVPC